MISRFDLDQRVREWDLREDVVEKDYVLGWLLWGIGSDEVLSTTWAFKGGTCLKKCYLETFRFSEDLDFSVLPGGPVRSEEVEPHLLRVLRAVHEQSGISLDSRPPRLTTHPSGNYTEGRIYYRGPRNAPTVASIRVDLLGAEVVVRPTVRRPIAHAFPDELPAPATVRCYSFEEVFAEKLRAMGERSRPRDLYDIVHLFRRRDFRHHAEVIGKVLVEKCEHKGIPIPSYASIEASPLRQELETEWANMLAHQLPQLPPFQSFWSELPELFAWLNGADVGEELDPIGSEVEMDSLWRPPATLWTWGAGAPVEPIRFAASNHLCIELGYGGDTRLVEPYSFRRTKRGDILLFAIKASTREVRAYRLDRIQSVRVASLPFQPVYRIEIGGAGSLATPQLRHPRAAKRPTRARPRRGR